jgi:heptose I phosphotransferase
MEATFWQRLVRGVSRLYPSTEFERFAGPDWPGQIMAMAVTDRLHRKQGRSIGRLALESEGQRLVVYLKRHYRLPWWHGLGALLRPGAGWSPALQEWDHLRWAQEQGLPVPEALAAGEFIGPWGRLQSFLVVKELTGMLPLHQAIAAAATNLDAASFRRWKRGLAAEMARLAAQLHRRRRFHKDFYLCHFYVADEDTVRLPRWQGRVHLIDLHRLSHHRWTWPLWLVKDLGQLWYSSEIPGVEPRDRIWFWRAYCRENPAARAMPWLRLCIRLKAWNYRRHGRQRGGRLPPEGKHAAATHNEPAPARSA